ncbi:ANL family adenylate-forming protein [Planctomycetaceae bacterium SH139]
MSDWVQALLARGERLCFVGGPHDQRVTYREMVDRIAAITELLTQAGVSTNSVVAFPGQYSADNVATLLAIADRKAVAVPLPDDAPSRIERLLEIAHVTHRVASPVVDVTEEMRIAAGNNPLYARLRANDHAGLVLFTSGTTGDPKAAVQNLDRLKLRYAQPRQVGMMLAFMHIDHIGGINTLLYVLSHGGTLVVPKTRSPHDVAASIAEHRIQVLPVSPTFLNLLLISGAADRFDLSSLRRITYGSEPMPQSVLERVAERLPGVELLQTYGTTELGILKSKSENNGSLWMKVGGDGYETKIAQGRLWVKAQTAMLGYLNAASPFDDEGFMDTGDEVEVRGDWLRVLGRKSDFINVGGTKVSPVEVESVLLEMACVAEVAVVGRPHPIMGQVVEARVRLCGDGSISDFKAQMRKHCHGRLPAEAIPVKVSLTNDSMVTDRFKRVRQ